MPFGQQLATNNVAAGEFWQTTLAQKLSENSIPKRYLIFSCVTLTDTTHLVQLWIKFTNKLFISKQENVKGFILIFQRWYYGAEFGLAEWNRKTEQDSAPSGGRLADSHGGERKENRFLPHSAGDFAHHGSSAFRIWFSPQDCFLLTSTFLRVRVDFVRTQTRSP